MKTLPQKRDCMEIQSSILSLVGWILGKVIGVFKSTLRRVLGRACLNNEELTTILCDVENIINSRPLTYLSEDPKDLLALTPAMFLQEIKSTGVCDIDIIDSKRLNKKYNYQLKLQKDL